ncbi:MAG: hypothetical protein IKP54_11555 [Bacteroidales bacterium]|nr:hypothetical protein [Bacteroidales bacterium]
MRTPFVYMLLAILLLLSCSQTPKQAFPKVKDISEYEQTQFLPTLEHRISTDTNSVYCATLLFAWDEARNIIGAPLSIPEEYQDLILLNASTSYRNVLKDNEYKVKGEVQGDLITARAEFDKSLPFPFELQKFNNSLTFDGQMVAAFGVAGYERDEMTNIVDILYYENDDNFIIKLAPTDTKHEIILFKTGETYTTMAEMVAASDSLIKIGKQESVVDSTRWKYRFDDDDMVMIPDMSFNISADFNKLINNTFTAKHKSYRIIKAWQRIAFLLNETGAKIESEAAVEMVLECLELERPVRHEPKSMIFDKPFFLMLHRTDAQYPYCCMHLVNSELMVKE